MRSSLLLGALALSLAACDSGAPEAPASASSFEVTVAPGTADARLVSGSATASGGLSGRFIQIVNPEDLGDLTVTGLDLRAESGPEQFLLVGLTDGPLAPGTFSFDALTFGGGEVSEDESSFLLIYLPDGEPAFDPNTPQAIAVGFGSGGSLTVDTATDETIAGSFTATVELLDADGGSEEIELEGTFTADAGE